MNWLGEGGRTATTRLHEQLKSSRVGQRWERMFRLHAHEVEAVLAIYPDVRDNVAAALTALAAGSPLDTETISSVERVLDDLQRHASVPLQRDITRVRDEVLLARGRTLQQVLVD